MSPRLIRTVAGLIGIAAGVAVAYYFVQPLVQLTPLVSPFVPVAIMFVIPLLSGLFLYLISPGILRGISQLTGRLEAKLSRVPAVDIVSGLFGLIIGLVIGALMTASLVRIPVVGSVLPTAVSSLLGYLGWRVAIQKREDILVMVASLRGGGRGGAVDGRDRLAPKLLDTSTIIDGRIADIHAAGFIEGPLLLPQFVLDELQHIADSTDPVRRNRGRKGLDVLAKLQQELGADLRIEPYQLGGIEVDARLVQLARDVGAKIITNDFNLNKVASLHGVAVLNINELAKAMKPVVLPGEAMSVLVTREGKEPGQGVGYMDDGTMIVIEGGKAMIGEVVEITVTSVLQTSAGRMIFARPKSIAQEAL